MTALRRLLVAFRTRLSRRCTVLVMDEDPHAPPRSYTLVPGRLAGWAAAAALAALVLGGAGGYAVRAALRPAATAGAEAPDGAARLAALEDSLAVQATYLEHMRRLLTGQMEPGTPIAPDSLERADDPEGQPAAAAPAEPPRAAPVRLVADGEAPAGLHLPVLPPVEGFATRGFDARAGHFALDLAVRAGTVVRAIGPGYVVFADWTHEGGYTLIVQHPGGYASVYKHNQRLLKRPGDRVRDREGIAISGNTGEVTTGPHLHFELWRNGLALDPRSYLINQ